ncbi:hypothetical protein GGD71_006370 [Variovorax guangxiensis]|uniref:LysR substrate-binding domain-containing protein n=2 Tax=Variovorax guangxiensis TaxID=1775474 RepID=A0A840G2N2_9BURK|nr:hypothetical protein [Variovorax guangxiensis]
MALPGAYSPLRQLFDISCSRQGLAFEPAFLSNRLDAMISYVVGSEGIALSGEAAPYRPLEAGDLVAVPLRDREMNERISRSRRWQGAQCRPLSRLAGSPAGGA